MTDSKKIDDGGPAFAGGLFEPQHGGSNDREPWNPGMSLRDWLAGQALPAACTLAFGNIGQASTMGFLPEEWAAKIAYSVSDAMIAARKGGEA